MIFSRPYFSNGQAVVMFVVRRSVRLSVTDVLWLNSCHWSLIGSRILAFK